MFSFNCICGKDMEVIKGGRADLGANITPSLFLRCQHETFLAPICAIAQIFASNRSQISAKKRYVTWHNLTST